jgi:hypothetical protein
LIVFAALGLEGETVCVEVGSYALEMGGSEEKEVADGGKRTNI